MTTIKCVLPVPKTVSQQRRYEQLERAAMVLARPSMPVEERLTNNEKELDVWVPRLVRMWEYASFVWWLVWVYLNNNNVTVLLN